MLSSYFLMKKYVPPSSSRSLILPNFGTWLPAAETAVLTFFTIFSMGRQASTLLFRVDTNVFVNCELSDASSYPAEVNTCDDLALVSSKLSQRFSSSPPRIAIKNVAPDSQASVTTSVCTSFPAYDCMDAFR